MDGPLTGIAASAAQRRRKSTILLPMTALCLLPFGGGDGEDPPNARQLLEKWLQVRQQISRETREWELQRELLDSRIALVQRELDAADGKSADVLARITENRKGIAEAKREKAVLDQATAGLPELVAGLEERLRTLLPRLPETLRNEISAVSQRLPSKPEASPATAKVEAAPKTDTPRPAAKLVTRMQVVIELLKRIDKFNSEVSIRSETRDVGDGKRAAVSVVYLGLGQAFYATEDGKYAGTGVPTDEGWHWTIKNDLGPAVVRAVGMKNGKPAAFVALPVQVRTLQQK
ncbi:MAG: DUF3450 family protein [Planctomycetes bacterium]|nr:DUF3450 family protein [Planctomycetota bacterium]MCB9868305.1 DUF3450 family protein [Planctomycetota bacterium]